MASRPRGGAILLDTSVCVAILREKPTVVARAAARSPNLLVVASMTEAELRYGAAKSRDPEATFRRTELLLDTLGAVLPFDRAAARAHTEARLALRQQPIGERDLVIASVALAHGLAVATGNVREFGRVPGLVVEDWLA